MYALLVPARVVSQRWSPHPADKIRKPTWEQLNDVDHSIHPDDVIFFTPFEQYLSWNPGEADDNE